MVLARHPLQFRDTPIRHTPRLTQVKGLANREPHVRFREDEPDSRVHALTWFHPIPSDELANAALQVTLAEIGDRTVATIPPPHRAATPTSGG